MCLILPFSRLGKSLLFQAHPSSHLLEVVIRPAVLLQSFQKVHGPTLKVDLADAERSAGVDGEVDASGWTLHVLR